MGKSGLSRLYAVRTLCVNCPMGVETPQLIAAARSALVAAGKAPKILTELADMAISREENAELYRDFFLGAGQGN